MELPETHLVTEDNGIRPAGVVDRCFYCDRSLGEEHTLGCALRLQRVTVRFSIDYQIDIPAWWGPGELESHRNEGTWCVSNGIEEIYAAFVDQEEDEEDVFWAPIDPCAYSHYTWIGEDAPVAYAQYAETVHAHRSPPDDQERESVGDKIAGSYGYTKRRYD